MTTVDQMHEVYEWAVEVFSKLSPYVSLKMILEPRGPLFSLTTLRMKIIFLVEEDLTKEALLRSFLQRLSEAPLDWVDAAEINDWRVLATKTSLQV